MQANRSKWEALNIDDYTYTLQRSCFCGPNERRPVDITVHNGEVTSAKYADTGEPLPENASFNRLTIPDLFDQIQGAIDQNAERIDVTYDPQTGIPGNMYIDISSQIADEEMGITATNFQPIGTPNQGAVLPQRNVIGFGNRMPVIIQPGEQVAPRDYVILGDANSYPAPAASITIDGTTTPVTRENGQYFARGLEFPHAGMVQGSLQLADGSVVPLNIRVEFAY
ncbi:MAG TPA: hypothetical protein ENJ35_10760 [Gammaproteobacteria bacterium]|nr:hypothetical protein [Gammaproteobacteria bacterium]